MPVRFGVIETESARARKSLIIYLLIGHRPMYTFHEVFRITRTNQGETS
jgi:hypothetical protein